MNAKKLCASLAILALVVLGGSASFAEIGTIDAVPAATLLLPYFEADLDNPQGIDTLFAVSNASAASAVAHVVIWSDMTIPVLDFNIYLTGYDVETVSMRNIIVNGALPATADEGADPIDAVSPNGNSGVIPTPLSMGPADHAGTSGNPAPSSDPQQWDFDYPSCEGAPGSVPALLLDRLQQGLTGQATQFDTSQAAFVGDACVGFDHNDRIARGYVTIDNSNDCSVLFPGDTGYFGTGGVSSTENQLWGDFFIVDQANDFAIGETLVHIEGGANIAPGTQSFYGRYVAFDGSDDREPLPNQFGVRYLQGAAFDGGTDLLVWREGAPWAPSDSLAFPCNGSNNPTWFPMNESTVVAFDLQEQWEELCEPTTTTSPISPNTGSTDDPNCFPLEAQRVTVGDPLDNLHLGELSPSASGGWLFLDLQAAPTTVENQAWVIANMSALNRFSVGFDAIQLNSTLGEPGFLFQGN